jgi:type VI secretion system protein ImpH
MPSFRDRDDMRDLAKLFFAGRFVAQPRNGEGLAAIVSTYFHLPAQVEEFVGEWLALPEAARWRLGRSKLAGVLGQTTVAGARTWQRQSKFRVVLGPLDEDAFESMLPGGTRLPQLVAIVRNYVGDSLNWDVRLRLRRRVDRPFNLGRHSRLAWSTWLGRCPERERRQDVILNPLRFMPASRPRANSSDRRIEDV